MPLTQKGAKILEAMQAHYGAKKGTSVFYASANKGSITGVHQTHHQPVTASPFHGLRPPPPAGAHPTGGHDFIPPGQRSVRASPTPTLQGDVPAHMSAAARSQHMKLALEIAGGIRRLSFGAVRHDVPGQASR